MTDVFVNGYFTLSGSPAQSSDHTVIIYSLFYSLCGSQICCAQVENVSLLKYITKGLSSVTENEKILYLFSILSMLSSLSAVKNKKHKVEYAF